MARLNVRKALTGQYLLQGERLVAARRLGGFRESTARGSGQRTGLTAEACVAESRKLASGAEPATLLNAVRQRFKTELDSYKPGSLALDRFARVVETAERHYGTTETTGGADDNRTMIQRLTVVQQLVVVATERGLLGKGTANPGKTEELTYSLLSDPGSASGDKEDKSFVF